MTMHTPPAACPHPADEAIPAGAAPRSAVCPVLRAYAQQLAAKNWPAQDDFPAALGGALAALVGTAATRATERARATFLAASQIVHRDHGCDLSEGLAGMTLDRRPPVEAALRRALHAYIATLRVDDGEGGDGEPRVLADDATVDERAAWAAEGAALGAAYRLEAEALVAAVLDAGVAPATMATRCATYLDDEGGDSPWALGVLRDASAAGGTILPWRDLTPSALTPQAVMAFLGDPATPTEAVQRFFDRVVGPCAPEEFPPPGTPVEVQIERGRFRGTIIQSYLGASGQPLAVVETSEGVRVYHATRDPYFSRPCTWRHVPAEGGRLVMAWVDDAPDFHGPVWASGETMEYRAHHAALVRDVDGAASLFRRAARAAEAFLPACEGRPYDYDIAAKAAVRRRALARDFAIAVAIIDRCLAAPENLIDWNAARLRELRGRYARASALRPVEGQCLTYAVSSPKRLDVEAWTTPVWFVGGFWTTDPVSGFRQRHTDPETAVFEHNHEWAPVTVTLRLDPAAREAALREADRIVRAAVMAASPEETRQLEALLASREER